MTSKYPKNVFKATYKRVKIERIKHSLYLQDLIASHLSENSHILKKAEQSLDQYQLNQTLEQNQSNSSQLNSKEQVIQQIQNSLLFQQFIQSLQTMDEELQLQKLAKQKKSFNLINQKYKQKLRKTIQKIQTLKESVKKQYFNQYCEHKNKQKWLKQQIKAKKVRDTNNQQDIVRQDEKQDKTLAEAESNLSKSQCKIIEIKRKIKQNQTMIRVNKKQVRSQIHTFSIFLLALLKNGYYSNIGLKWIFIELSSQFHSLLSITQFHEEQTNEFTLVFKPSELITIYENNFVVKSYLFPQILDNDSKQYILKMYEDMLKKVYSQFVNQNKTFESQISQRKFQFQLKKPSSPISGTLNLKNLVQLEPIISKTQNFSTKMNKVQSSINHQTQKWTTNRVTSPSQIPQSLIQCQNNQDMSGKLNIRSNHTLETKNKKNIFMDNNQILDLKKNRKSFNFDTKKIYSNTKEILSNWIQNTQKSPLSKESFRPQNLMRSKIVQVQPGKSRVSIRQQRIGIEGWKSEKIENRSNHKKKINPLSNYLKSSFKIESGESQVQREQRRIDHLYKPENRKMAKKLVFGINFKSQGQVPEIDYLSY